jgi:ornithine carbamoyltransferase
MSFAARATARPLITKDFLSVLDLSPAELVQVLDLAASLKRDRTAPRLGRQPLDRKHVGLLFAKPSLRTRVTFAVAVRELGGEVIDLAVDAAMGGREDAADVARNLERWIDGVVVRTFDQRDLAAFAAAAPRLHVVNALTNQEHPCQALADMLTMRERLGSLVGRTLAFVGDGNNVAASLAHAGVMLGLEVRVASPAGFELKPDVVAACARVAAHGGRVRVMDDPREAVAGADAIYTDVWASMGQEDEAQSRAAIFQPYQVNETLMARAPEGALFMHCLPAHRGMEVTNAVIDSPVSVVYDQAENRLHTQKALLALLIP